MKRNHGIIAVAAALGAMAWLATPSLAADTSPATGGAPATQLADHHGGGHHMGRGMRGRGMMGHRGMGGHMMGRGMMGRGGFGMRVKPSLDLSTADVTRHFERRLKMHRNGRLKLGEVKRKDDDTITADVVTKEGSLVHRYQIDRHTGRMRPVRE